MNKVISDTAEYGCYLFSHACVPLLLDFMSRVDTSLVGTKFNKGDNGVDNLYLLEVNASIQNHPVELIGLELRGYMTEMKRIAVGGIA
jgi:ketol-acid reductoisomerase